MISLKTHRHSTRPDIKNPDIKDVLLLKKEIDRALQIALYVSTLYLLNIIREYGMPQRLNLIGVDHWISLPGGLLFNKY